MGDFMSPFGKCQRGAAIAAALVLMALPSISHAYTPEEQQACQPDAFRLCGPEIPDVDRVTACMIAKKSQLSPQCRAFFRPGPEPDEATSTPAAAPMNIKPAAVHKPKAKKAKVPRAKAS
jgi:hypothetical protein